MTRHSTTRNLLIAAICASVLVFALLGAARVAKVDAFARFEQTDGSASIKLNDVEIKHWRGDKLVTRANAAELTVNKNRTVFDLKDLSSGIFEGEDGRFEFAADQATWDSTKLVFFSDQPARLASKDFDLLVPEFRLERKTSSLSIPKEIQGTLRGGRVRAAGFKYSFRDGSYRLGRTDWVGFANFQGSQGQPSTPTKWTFQAAGGTRRQRDLEVWEDARATDGEIVVQGKKLERNVKTDVVTATGDVLYFSPKANLACEKVVIYRKEKRAVLTGNVKMLIKPKDSMDRKVEVGTGEIAPFRPVVPDALASSRPASQSVQQDKALNEEIRTGKTTRKYPIVVTAAQIEYWCAKGGRKAIITGEPQATQQLAGERWRKVWANKVLYDAEKESMRLLSTEGKHDVRMTTSLGDDVTANWFELSTKEGDDEWSANAMQGTVVSDDEEVNEAVKDGGTAPVQAPPAPPTGDKPSNPSAAASP